MGPGGGKLSIRASQGWSAALLQHTGLLSWPEQDLGLCSSDPAGVEAVVALGSPPAALGWGQCLDTGICQPLEPEPACPSQLPGILANLTAGISGSRLLLQAFLGLHMTARTLCRSWPRVQYFRLKMNFKQRQHRAQPMVSEGDKKPQSARGQGDGQSDPRRCAPAGTPAARSGREKYHQWSEIRSEKEEKGWGSLTTNLQC